ncbi:MAG: glycosyltransferase family 9 protein [Planctomycetota bacterium]
MKILLIQHRQIGDVLMCTPAVRALRRHLPEANITFVVESFSHSALKYNPHINAFIIPPKDIGPGAFMALHWKAWRSRYDVVIDFFRNPKSAWLTWCTRAPRRISFTGRYRKFAYTTAVDAGDPETTYAAVRKLRLLGPLGITEEKDCLPEFFISDVERQWCDRVWDDLKLTPADLVIAISPVSRKQYRVWPAVHYARLCDHLVKAHGAKVILTWGPGEEGFIKPITSTMQARPITGYPMPGLTELQALLGRCDLVIANNNGPRHMAIAAGTPTLGLFSKLSPAHWTPPGNPLHLVIQPDPVRDARGNVELKAENLPVERAIAAADKMIADLKRGREYRPKG